MPGPFEMIILLVLFLIFILIFIIPLVLYWILLAKNDSTVGIIIWSILIGWFSWIGLLLYIGILYIVERKNSSKVCSCHKEDLTE
ncbi:MAG: hypothetical protein ACRC10_03770 [Thermoguttaceae bacterium]